MRTEMKTFDLSLYLVLDPDLCGGAEGMLRTTEEALEGGVTIVQLRAPTWKKRALAACARDLLEMLRPRGIPLIINDHADVAAAVGADGLHVGQDDLSSADARRIIGPDMILGLSAGNVDEVRGVDPALVDYLGIGPVWATATKKDAGAAVGLDGLAALRAATPLPVVAIGGIGASNAADVMRTGVDGIAVVSAICGQASPRTAAENLLAQLRIADRS